MPGIGLAALIGLGIAIFVITVVHGGGMVGVILGTLFGTSAGRRPPLPS